MPVEACIFKFGKICLRDNFPQRKNNHDGDHDRADQDMQPVDACHYVIETEKKDLALTILQKNRRIRINAIKDLRRPFKIFIDEKDNTEKYRYYLKQGR